MEYSAKNIAALLNGEVIGDSEVKVSGVSKIEEGKSGTLSFLANPKYEPYIYTTDSSIVLVNKTFTPEKEVKTTLIKVKNAYAAVATLLEMYNKEDEQVTGIDSLAFIAESAKTGENVSIGAFSFIDENAVIGNNVKIYPQVYIGKNTVVKDNTVLMPGVKVYKSCKIGANCIIHAGVIIGSDGFGFAPNTGDYKKVPQVGNVIIEDHVEIGANTVVDRATLGSTIIRKGVKLDNLIQVAHNVEIGENTVMAGQSGISGSTKIGKNCMVGGQVGFAGHITVADGTRIGAQSGVSSSVKKENKTMLGSPILDIRDFRRSIVLFKYLPQLSQRITELEKELEQLKKS